MSLCNLVKIFPFNQEIKPKQTLLQTNWHTDRWTTGKYHGSRHNNKTFMAPTWWYLLDISWNANVSHILFVLEPHLRKQYVPHHTPQWAVCTTHPNEQYWTTYPSEQCVLHTVHCATHPSEQCVLHIPVNSVCYTSQWIVCATHPSEQCVLHISVNSVCLLCYTSQWTVSATHPCHTAKNE